MQPLTITKIIVNCVLLAAPLAVAQNAAIPHLQKQGTAQQLIVDGKPFLVLGGELHNSSSSDLEYMNPIWKRMVQMNFNTVLAGLNWELIEPAEGRYDFSLVDGLIAGARRNQQRLVFLWFGSWKNGQSSYIPLWVKRDFKRFPRVKLSGDKTVEVLSTFAQASWEADAKAYAALLKHIGEVDGKDHTVLMMQVENEVGVLGDSRDRSAPANEAFGKNVPQALVDYLVKNRAVLYPDLKKRWEAAGAKTAGDWETLFGKSPFTDEIFMAWYYASYVEKVAAAGKAAYPIPAFVNTWLSDSSKTPGFWPSGGPQPHVMDVWRAAASHIDLITPDIYQPNFAEWAARYTHNGNALFIPEMGSGEDGARKIFYAVGKHDAIGTSPFAVDSIPDAENAPLGATYAALQQMAPTILAHQGKGEMTGFLLNEQNPTVKATLGGYELEISLDNIFGRKAQLGYGLVISVGPDEFVGVGTGFQVSFKPTTAGPKLAGVGSVDEGTFKAGKWIAGRRLNGDENDQGGHWRFAPRKLNIERCVVYRYE